MFLSYIWVHCYHKTINANKNQVFIMLFMVLLCYLAVF